MDEFIDVLGRASLEAVLQLSAGTVAGPPHQGKAGGEVRRPGSQRGVVCLSTQKVRVRKPRLRRKGGERAEVAVPAYEAMQSDVALGEKLSSILLRGVSTRNCEDVIPEMAETCGVSKSSVGREFIAASAEQLKALAERRFDALDLLVIYIDGVQFGGHHVLGAVGVDTDGRKHVLGLAEGATENVVVVKGLLEGLVEITAPDYWAVRLWGGVRSGGMRSASCQSASRCFQTEQSSRPPASTSTRRAARSDGSRSGAFALATTCGPPRAVRPGGDGAPALSYLVGRPGCSAPESPAAVGGASGLVNPDARLG